MASFAAPLDLPELVLGGGLGVAYVEGESAPSLTEWAATVLDACRAAGVRSSISVEPGRAIVAAAAVTVYTIGTIKHIPGVRTYVAVDGGMSDNPRPVLYGSGYEAFLPRQVDADRRRRARVVGKHCESGDVLLFNARLPAAIAVGDLLAVPVTGAYGHSMGSNYNKVPRPPVVFVQDGRARLVVRRETYRTCWPPTSGDRPSTRAYPDPMRRIFDVLRDAVRRATTTVRHAERHTSRTSRRTAPPVRAVDSGVRSSTPPADGDPIPAKWSGPGCRSRRTRHWARIALS